MNPVCYIMIGMPASGKSTLVNTVLRPRTEDKSLFVYSTDDYIENYAKRHGKVYSDVFKDTIKGAIKEMDRNLFAALLNLDNIIWDQTNLTVNKRKSIIEKVKPHGYKVKGKCFIHPDVDDEDIFEYQKRVDGRKDKIIPHPVMKNMMASFTLPSLSEGFDSIDFYDIFGKKIMKMKT